MAIDNDNRRLFEIFDAVADLSPPEQRAALQIECGDNSALMAQLVELLQLDQKDVPLLMTTEGLLPAIAEAIFDTTTPTSLGPYKVIRKLGAGGMGVVFEAQQTTPHRKVAIKVVHPWLRSTASEALLLQEVQAMADVLHAGIPQVYQVFQAAGTTAVAMELVDGTDLGEAAAKMSRPDRALLLARVADAVHAAHNAGVIHRDLKPANIRVLPDGQPKVLDFGIASRRGHDSLLGSGTTAYASPEQVEGRPADVRSDIFSLGVRLYEVLLNKLPHQGGADRESIARHKRTPPDVPLPVALSAIVHRALAAETIDRYDSASAFSDDLRAWVEDLPVDALGFAPGARALAWSRRHRRPIAAALLTVMVLALTTYAGWTVRQRWTTADQNAQAERSIDALLSSPIDDDATWLAQMRGLAQEPYYADTNAISDGWIQVSERLTARSARREALVFAWSAAQTEPSRAQAAMRLIPMLERDEQWNAVRRMHKEVPLGMFPHLDVRFALERGDLSAAIRLATPAQRPLLELLKHVEHLPSPVGKHHRIVNGQRLVQSEGIVNAIDDAGVVQRTWPYSNGATAIDRVQIELTLGEPVQHPSAFKQGSSLADIDADGDLERLDLGGWGQAPLHIAMDPMGQSKTVLPWLSLPSNGTPGVQVTDLDQDGTPDIAITFRGWKFQGVGVFTDLTTTPRLSHMLLVSPARAAQAIVGPHGPEIVVLGQPAGTAPLVGTGMDKPDVVLATAHVAQGTLQLSHTVPSARGWMKVGDLDGDGLHDVVVGTAHDLHLYRRTPQGGWSLVQVPGCTLLDVGSLDADPDAEIWARCDGRSVVIGRAGEPLVTTQAPPTSPVLLAPEGATHGQARRWARAEALHALDLNVHASKQLLTLAASADKIRVPTLVHALERLDHAMLSDQPDSDDLHHSLRSEIAATLARVTPSESSAGAHAADVLRQELSWDVLSTLADSSVPFDWSSSRRALLSDDGLHPSAVIDPAAVRFHPVPGTVDVALSAGAAQAVSIPLNWDDDLLDITMDFETLEQDFGNALIMSVDVGGQPFMVQVGRGGGGQPSNHVLGLNCGAKRDLIRLPWRLGAHRLRLALDRRTGRVRCDLDGVANVAKIDIPHGPTRLELKARDSKNFGHITIRITDWFVTGATLHDSATPSAELRFVHGSTQAARALAQDPRPVVRLIAKQALGTSSQADLSSLDSFALHRLLRLDPGTWVPHTRRSLGDPVAAKAFVHAFGDTLKRQTPPLRQLLRSSVFANIELSSRYGWTLGWARSRALLHDGRSTQALGLLRRLAAEPPSSRGDQDVGKVWLQIARLALARGDRVRATQAVEAALQQSNQRLYILAVLWDEPQMASLVDLAPPARVGAD